MIEQQYYTSSPQTRDGNAGFGVLAQTPEMPAALAQKAAKMSVYGTPYRQADDDVAAMPVSFTYYAIDADRGAITNIRYVGQDYSGRFGNFFAHTLLLDDESLKSLENAPVLLAGSDLWVAEAPHEIHDLPALHGLPAIAPVSPEVLRDFICAEPERTAHFAEMLQALIERGKTNRRLILVDTPENTLRWIQALSLMLPVSLRRGFTFSTYQRNPYSVDVALTATRPDGDFRFTQSEYQFQFAIFHFEEARFSAGIVPGRAAKQLGDSLAAGDYARISRVAAIVDQLGAAALGDLDRVCAVDAAQAEGAPLVSLETLTEAVDCLLSAPPSCAENALFFAAEFFSQVSAEGEMARMELLAPAYHDMAKQHGRMQQFHDDCLELLTLHLESSAALPIVRFFIKQGKERPWFQEFVQKSIPEETWAALAQNRSVGENELRELWPLFQRILFQEAAHGAKTVLTALVGWERARGFSVVQENLLACAKQAQETEAPILERILDALSLLLTGPQIPSYLPVYKEFLKLRLRSSNEQGSLKEMVRVAGFLCEERDQKIRDEGAAELIGLLSKNPSLLLVAIEALLRAVPSLETPIARTLYQQNLHVNPEFLTSLTAKASLEPLLTQMWEISSENRDLARFVRARIFCFSGKIKATEAEHVLSAAVGTLHQQQATAQEYDRFLQELPEMKEAYPKIYGLLLMYRQALLPPEVLAGSAFAALHLAVEEAMNSRTWRNEDYCALLTLRLSIANEHIEKKKVPARSKEIIGFIEKYLQVPQNDTMRPQDYEAYVRVAYGMLLDNRVDIGWSGHLFEQSLWPALLPALIALFVEYVKATQTKSRERYSPVCKAVTSVGEACRYSPASAADTASLINLLAHSEQKEMDGELVAHFGQSRKQLEWWALCMEAAKKSGGSRFSLPSFLDRLPFGRK